MIYRYLMKLRCFFEPVLRIRIHLIRIRIQLQHFRLNTDPDPIWIRFRIQSGSRALMTKNWKKITGLHKERPSYRRSLQLSKEAIQHFKTWTKKKIYTFVGHFCPPGSVSGFRIRIRIHWPGWIRIQSGSATLLWTLSWGYLALNRVVPRKSHDIDNLYKGKYWIKLAWCRNIASK